MKQIQTKQEDDHVQADGMYHLKMSGKLLEVHGVSQNDIVLRVVMDKNLQKHCYCLQQVAVITVP